MKAVVMIVLGCLLIVLAFMFAMQIAPDVKHTDCEKFCTTLAQCNRIDGEIVCDMDFNLSEKDFTECYAECIL